MLIIKKNGGKERRYIVVRQNIQVRPQAPGKQMTIFENDALEKKYRYSLCVTNNLIASPYEIWNYYKPLANDENIIENMKSGFGFSAFNLKNF